MANKHYYKKHAKKYFSSVLAANVPSSSFRFLYIEERFTAHKKLIHVIRYHRKGHNLLVAIHVVYNFPKNCSKMDLEQPPDSSPFQTENDDFLRTITASWWFQDGTNILTQHKRNPIVNFTIFGRGEIYMSAWSEDGNTRSFTCARNLGTSSGDASSML